MDFRSNLIAVPQGFTDGDIHWAQEYILATTRAFGSVRQPLWSVFAGKGYGVVGVTCWAGDVSTEMIHDEHGRPLYVFLGYVTTLPMPGIPLRRLKAFAPLYEFVKERWFEKSYQARGVRDHPFDLEAPLVESTAVALDLNVDERRIAVWPVAYDESVWRAAGQAEEVSVCIGFPQAKDILQSKFLNATAHDVDRPGVLERSTATGPGDAGELAREREIVPLDRSRHVDSPSILRELLSLILALFGRLLEGFAGSGDHRRPPPRPGGIPPEIRPRRPALGGPRVEEEHDELTSTPRSTEALFGLSPRERRPEDARPQNEPPPGFRAPARPRERKKGRWEGW